MDEENELVCEECGAKLTGEEGIMLCWYCQEEDETTETIPYDPLYDD